MQKHDAAGNMSLTVRVASTSPATADSRKVRMGAQAPSLPRVKNAAAAIADNRKVRMGAQAPSLPDRKSVV